MTRMEQALPKTVLLLLTGVFDLVDGEKWISMNGENGSAYTTSGQAVNITCTIAIPYQPGAFIFADQAIWRAVGVSTELSPTSTQWSVVIDNFHRPGYTPDPARMSIWFGEHPSTYYMQIGLTIHVPFPRDSGMYFCNGSYVEQSGGSLIVDNSAQVYLSVTGTTKAATWITVNDRYVASYFNTALHQGDRFKLHCHSYVTDGHISIEEQYIMKSQSYLIDPLNGSSPYEYPTGSSRMEEYRMEDFESYDILMLGPTRPTKRKMISGFDFGRSCSNTGMYSCFMLYKVRGNKSNFANALNFRVVVTNTPFILPKIDTKDKLGIEKYILPKFSEYDLILNDTITVATTDYLVIACTEYPAFQVTVNDADVTSSLNIFNSKPELVIHRPDTPGFSSLLYSLLLSYSLPFTSVCSWKVTYRVWSPTIPSKSNTISLRLITRSCIEKERGTGLKSKASLEAVTSLKSGLIICTMLSASLIQVFTS